MPNPLTKKTVQKTKTTLDEQIKIAHQILWPLCAFLIFIVGGTLLAPKARLPQVLPSPPEVEKIQAEHPFGYPRISQTFVPAPCDDDNNPNACYQLDNLDYLDIHPEIMQFGLPGYEQIKQRNPEIIYTTYELPHINYISAYEAGHQYWRERWDFMDRIWVKDGKDWHYFRSQGQTNLASGIPESGEDFYISVDDCRNFIEGHENNNPYNAYIKIWPDSNRGNYEIIKVEDNNGDGDVCDPGNQLWVTERGVGPSSPHSHSVVEKAWNYLNQDFWPYLIELDFTRNRPAWSVDESIDGWQYCHRDDGTPMRQGELCQVTDWLPHYVYDKLSEPGDNFSNGIFWDVFLYGAPYENLYTENIAFEALDELQSKFRQASGNQIQQTANQPIDFQNSGMTGGLVSEWDLRIPLLQVEGQNIRNMILEMINTAERWQDEDEYNSNLPLTLIDCCTYQTGILAYRFNLILGNIMGAFFGGKDDDRDGPAEDWDPAIYSNWIDEYAVDLSGNAFIKNQDDWDAESFTGASPERHYLGDPVIGKDKELLFCEPGERNCDLQAQNRVTNGSFESDSSNWSIATQNGDTASKSSVDCRPDCVEGERALKVDITQTGGQGVGNIELTGDVSNLTPGNIYTVEFWAKAQNPRVFFFALNDDDNTFDELTIWDVYVGKEWKQFLFTFKAEERVNKIQFRLGRDGEHPVGGPFGDNEAIDIWFDNIKIRQGDGFIGYQQEFENGLMLVNPAPSQEGASDTFKVPEGQYRKILGCTGDAHCDRAHNSGEVIDSAYNNNYYNCSQGDCYLTIDALDGYVLLKTGVSADLDITLTGDSSVPQGENYILTTTIQNNSSQIQNFDVWHNLTLPSGENRPDYLGPFMNITLAQEDTLIRYDELFAGVEPGTYTFTANLGDYASQEITTSDTLEVEVTSSGGFNIQDIEPEFRIEGSTTYLWREAERSTITFPMARASDPNASDGYYILTPDAIGNGNGDPSDGQAQYTINIPGTGNYIIWGRVMAPRGADNQTNDSFFVKMDDGTDLTWDLFQNAPGPYQDTWGWDQVSSRGTGSISNPEFDPMIFNLTEGAHILIIKNREDGTKLDKLLITNDLDYVPEEMGE